jgi:hypothetical protein
VCFVGGERCDFFLYLVRRACSFFGFFPVGSARCVFVLSISSACCLFFFFLLVVGRVQCFFCCVFVGLAHCPSFFVFFLRFEFRVSA